MRAILRNTALFVTLFASACVHPGTPAQRKARAASLATDLANLSPTVQPREAAKLAETAVEHSAQLAAQYRPITVSWLNNNLVNSGIRQRGLCWHWRDDLFPHLFALKLHTLDLHLATAKPGTAFEHNAIVVTEKNGRFENGIVLDPWRKSGTLVWKKVGEDRHPWQPLPQELTPDSLRPMLMPQEKR